MKALIVFGTRPEAIKMAPVVRAFKDAFGDDARVCVTAQHRGLLDQVLRIFQIVPEYDLNLMTTAQTLTDVSVGVLTGLAEIFAHFRPDVVLVHGDTNTALSSALAAFYAKIPVAHVEAGLRTYDLEQPWPEEMNRLVVDQIAHAHFAPTAQSATNLRAEGIDPDRTLVTGNTVVDALLDVRQRILASSALRLKMEDQFAFLDPSRKLILVTGHRRENHESGLGNVCQALSHLAERDDVQVVYPAHPNPAVMKALSGALAARSNIHVIEPLDYLPFVYLMDRAHLILTDSGGIQEEAPSLGKPVLVFRNVTERPEAVEAGTVRLVGTDTDRIVAECRGLLDSPAYYQAFSERPNPYGDGQAAQRILDWMAGEKGQEMLRRPLRKIPLAVKT